jgi:uracil-DNA glycosylase family 4
MCFARSEWPLGALTPVLHLPCDVLFVGEAPGPNEDTDGRPFVGPAGALLDKIIERSIPEGVTYAMTNLVCCFPRHAKERGDNEPERGEVLECRPRLYELINLAQPRLIVQVGSLVEQHLKSKHGVPTVHITHPAFILSKMVPAKKSHEVNRSIVAVKSALRRMLQSPKPQWKDWEVENAETEAREKSRRVRDAYRQSLRGQDDIPF